MKNTIEFEDKIYILKYKIKALTLLRKHWDCSLMELMTRIHGLDESDLPMLLYAGMIEDQPNITQKQIEKLIDDYPNIVNLLILVYQSFMGKIPRSKKDKESEKKEKN